MLEKSVPFCTSAAMQFDLSWLSDQWCLCVYLTPPPSHGPASKCFYSGRLTHIHACIHTYMHACISESSKIERLLQELQYPHEQIKAWPWIGVLQYCLKWDWQDVWNPFKSKKIKRVHATWTHATASNRNTPLSKYLCVCILCVYLIAVWHWHMLASMHSVSVLCTSIRYMWSVAMVWGWSSLIPAPPCWWVVRVEPHLFQME